MLRPLPPAEAAGLAERIASDPEASPWWGTAVESITRWLTELPASTFVIEHDGREAGVVIYEEEDDPDYRYAALDITLLEGYTNRGIGSRALRMLIRWLAEHRGHHRFTIDPAANNARAIRAYEKVGFKPVGIMRKCERGADGWHDNLLMDLLAEELTGDEAL